MQLHPPLLGTLRRKAGATYIIAELSANHNKSFSNAMALVDIAKSCGADAVKLQTYTADTITIDSTRAEFICAGGPWKGRTLYDLYEEAHMPWDWQPPIFKRARQLGLDCFSSPFDETAVDFLETLDPPAHKIASFELVDLPLIEYVASKGRPVIMSTGMASVSETSAAVEILRSASVPFALLKCTSSYPSPPESMNLRTISHLSAMYRAPAGLSDHTLGVAVPVAAVALGACIVEKHLTTSRDEPGPDSAFSLEPGEFATMVDAIRSVEKALGDVCYAATEAEAASRRYRRSLYAVQDIEEGKPFTKANVRSIRPGLGLPPKHLRTLLLKKAARTIPRGTPLSWNDVR